MTSVFIGGPQRKVHRDRPRRDFAYYAATKVDTAGYGDLVIEGGMLTYVAPQQV